MNKTMKNWIFKISIIMLVIVADIASKYFFAEFFKHNSDIVLIENLVVLTYTQNTGAAFGIFSSSTLALTIVSLLFIAVLFFYDAVYKEKNMLYTIAFSLIIGGAIGNVIDRIFLGYVRDFVWMFSSFVCNIADICLSVGVFLYVLHTLIEFNKSRKNDKINGTQN